MRGRRIKPRTREGRLLAAELGRIISNGRTPKANREAALRELDLLAPLEGSGSPLTPGSSAGESILLAAGVPVPAAPKPPAAAQTEKYPLCLTPDEISKVAAMPPAAARAAWFRLVRSQWPESGYGHYAQRVGLLHWRFEPIVRGVRAATFDEYFQLDREAHLADEAFALEYQAADPEGKKRLVCEHFHLSAPAVSGHSEPPARAAELPPRTL